MSIFLSPLLDRETVYRPSILVHIIALCSPNLDELSSLLLDELYRPMYRCKPHLCFALASPLSTATELANQGMEMYTLSYRASQALGADSGTSSKLPVEDSCNLAMLINKVEGKN